VLDSLVGLGTGSLRESYDALVAGGARFYVSGMSSKARGFDPADVAEAAMPNRLVELALEAPQAPLEAVQALGRRGHGPTMRAGRREGNARVGGRRRSAAQRRRRRRTAE
jgi:hypothetical protein